MKRFHLLALLASTAALAELQPQTVTPVGTAAHNAVTIQGSASGVAIPVTGSLSVSGTADTPGNTATFNANNVCTSVLTAGEQSVGFHLAAGTLDATLTAYYLQSTAAVNCATAGTCTTAAFSSGSTIVVTNPNGAKDVGVNVVGGIRQVEVCTTTYNSGSATGVVTATFVQAASSGGGGGSVTQGTSPWVVAGGGTAGTAASGVVTVQGIASMTAVKVDGSAVTQPISAASLPLPSTASTDASVTGLEVAQGSTTSGQNGPLVQGATTASAPTYTTAKTAPLSLQTDGSLRVAVTAGGGSNASVVTDGAAPPASDTMVAGSVTTAAPTYTTGQSKPLSVQVNGSLRAAVTDALPAGSNVIGHVVADSGSTTAVTGNVTAIQGTGSNLHAQLDSGSTTAVTQATGTNLHAVLDTTSTTAVTQATGTNLHAVLDTTSTTAVTQATGSNLHAVLDSGTTTVTQGTGTNLHAVLDSGTTTVTQGTGTNLHVDVDTALPAGTNVIGHVIADSGSTTAVTGNVTVVQPTGTNLHAVLDTTSTTAVTQATAANLNATVTQGPAGASAWPTADSASSATGSTVPASGSLIAGGAAGGAGNLTGSTVKAASTLPATTDTALVVTERDAVKISDGILVPLVASSGYSPQPQDQALNVTISPNSSIKAIVQVAPKVQIVNESGRSPAVLAPQQAPTGFEQPQVVALSPNPAPVCPFNVAISQTASTKIIAGQAGRRVFICSILVVSTTAQSLALVDGTGSTCGSAPTTAIIGSTTVANGPALAANGGFAQASPGPIYTEPDLGSDVCLLQSGAGNVGGAVTYTFF